MKNLWNNFTDSFGETIIHPQFLLRKHLKLAIDEAKKYSKGKLLDIGCGRMPYRKKLEPLVEKYIGVDHPKISKLYHSSQKPDVLADAKDLPFEENSFDIALMLQILEYLDEPQTALNEAGRVLKKDGVLILTSPFLYPIHDAPYDKGRYTGDALKTFFEDAGFKKVKIIPQGTFWEFWFLSLNVYFVRRIKDLIRETGIKKYILAPILVITTPVIVLFSNILGILGAKVEMIPNSQNYFPLNYLVVAKKS